MFMLSLFQYKVGGYIAVLLSLFQCKVGGYIAVLFMPMWMLHAVSMSFAVINLNLLNNRIFKERF